MERRLGRLVGRHKELRDLWEWLDRGGPLLLEGDPGSGKTTLVRAFCDAAAREGWSVRTGHCYESPPAVPFLPFVQVLSPLVPNATGRLPLEQVLGLDDRPRLEIWRQEASELRGEFLGRLSERILTALAGQKALLVIEDLQWADPESLLLLNHLLDVSAMLPVLLTARGDTRPKATLLRQLRGKAPRIMLPPLQEDELSQLAREITGVGSMSPLEVRWLFELTGGNALFASEVLWDLRRSGLLGQMSASEAALTLGVPTELGELLDRRLADVPEPMMHLLQIASACQAAIYPEVVAAAGGMSIRGADDSLSAAARLGLVVEVPDDTTEAYTFGHPFMRRRIYEGLSRSRRRQLHRDIAAACTGPAQATPEQDYLAVHLALGSSPQDRHLSCEASAQAAERAEKAYGFETAARFWQLAAASAPSRSVKSEYLYRLGLAWRAASDWDAAGKALERAFAITGEEGQGDLGADIALALGEIHRYGLALPSAIDWLHRCLELAPVPSSRAIRCLALLGSAHAAMGDVEPARQRLTEAMDLGREHEGELPQVAFWTSVGWATLGEADQARSVINEGLERARQTRDRHWSGLLASLLLQGDMILLKAENFDALVRDIAAMPEPKDAATLAREMVSRTLVAGYQGRWDDVMGYAETWMSQVRLAGRFQLATARLTWGEAALWRNDVGEAVEAMRSAVPDLGFAKPLGSLHLARALVRAGENAEARAIIAGHDAAASNTARSVPARTLMGDIACDLQDASLGAKLRAGLESERRHLAVGYIPISVARVKGRLAGLAGDWHEAFERLDAAAVSLAAGRAHWELVLTYLDHAELRLRRGRRGDGERALALEAEAVRVLRDQQLPIGILEERIDVSRVPPGARFGLSSRQLEVLQLVARGRSNLEIAQALGISPHTIDRHLENIFLKMNVGGRTEAVVEAFREGLIEPGGGGG